MFANHRKSTTAPTKMAVSVMNDGPGFSGKSSFTVQRPLVMQEEKDGAWLSLVFR